MGCKIHVCEAGFTNPGCGPVWLTILHEWGHAVYGSWPIWSHRKIAKCVEDPCIEVIVNAPELTAVR